MTKSLIDRIASRLTVAADNGEPLAQGETRATLLALKLEIDEALAKGFSRHVVWTQLREEGRVRVGYRGFLKALKKMQQRHATAQHQRPIAQPTTPGLSLGKAVADEPDEEDRLHQDPRDLGLI